MLRIWCEAKVPGGVLRPAGLPLSGVGGYAGGFAGCDVSVTRRRALSGQQSAKILGVAGLVFAPYDAVRRIMTRGY